MTVKQLVSSNDSLFFISFTCYKWINLFEITNFYSEIYKWFELIKRYECYITGYVIMPNHIHVMVGTTDQNCSLDKIIGNGKRFMAYTMVDILEEQGAENILSLLKEGVPAYEKKRGKKHQVFQPSFDIKPCFSESFIQQKLDYMHRNPVSGKWRLAEDFIDYTHSSARFYELNEQGLYHIRHYKDFSG